MAELPKTITPRPVTGADADILPAYYAVPGLGLVPINAFVLHAAEPVLVDTGAVVLRDEVLAAVGEAIDLDDLRWIYLTHVDPDHIGCLREVLSAAPRARVVTTFLGLGKLGLYAALPPERVYLLNPGQSLRVGDRELRALKPPTFDAPETTGVVDSKTGVLYSADCFGGLLSEPAESAAAIAPPALREGIVTWTTVDAPWLSSVQPTQLEKNLGAVRDLAPPIVLSAHLPPAFGMIDTLVAHVAEARTAPPFVGPDQRALTAMLAA